MGQSAQRGSSDRAFSGRYHRGRVVIALFSNSGQPCRYIATERAVQNIMNEARPCAIYSGLRRHATIDDITRQSRDLDITKEATIVISYAYAKSSNPETFRGDDFSGPRAIVSARTYRGVCTRGQGFTERLRIASLHFVHLTLIEQAVTHRTIARYTRAS